MKKTITTLVFLLICGWVSAAFDGGDGTSGNPYQVSTAAQLNDVRNFLSSYFIQTADIDLIAFTTGEGWVPIGNSTTKFTGNYDGSEHKIKHLYIYRITSTGDYSGLFGWINGATIKNLGVECNISGNSNTGGLAGEADLSTIQNCYTTGFIKGYNTTGGLFGGINIPNPLGIIGGSISNCYSRVIVSGNYYVGGLVGEAWRIPFTNCYSTGEVLGVGNLGGLAGRSFQCTTVNDCFWDTETTGRASSAIGTGKTTAEMKTQATFTNWDFASIPIWNIDTENNGYPHFNYQVFTHNKYYVKTTGSNSNDGSIWANAFLTLQKALETARSGDQIWVASGTYQPSVQVGGTGARFATFQMVEGVEIYGGFAGTESAVSERLGFGMGKANETILSGDLNGNDNYSVSPWTGTVENCYHVFYNVGLVSYLTSASVLDGFTIKGAFGTQYGGGMYNDGASPTFRNCIITNNQSYAGGGGIENYQSSILCKPTFINCLITNNIASSGVGAGMYNRMCKPLFVNTTIANNTSSGNGSAVYNMLASPTFNNCIIWGNTGGASSTSKQIYGDATLIFSCYANETNDNGGIITSSNCITIDPQMVNPSIGDCRIVGSSPCVDVGDDAYNSLTTDIRGSGFGRKVLKTNAATTGPIDMGAFEYKFGIDPPCLNASTGGVIGAAQTICSGGDPAAFTSTTPTGQSGSLDYKWQSSTIDATTEAGFSDISPNGTSETYDPPTGLTVTTWYRRLAKATCASDWLATTAVKVTVRTAFNAGSIKKSGEIICYSGNPVLIGDSIVASGGEGTISYQWQSSLDAAFTTPTDIGSNTASYDPTTNLTATTWYRRQTKDATCELTFVSSAQVWKVTVRPVFTAGSIKKSGEAICYNGNPEQIGDSIPASGGDAYIAYQWQSCTNAGFTGTPTDIATNAASYDPPANLTATTWYRRQAKDGACNTTFTSSGGVWKVTVDPASNGGNVSGGAIVCNGTNSTELTLYGQTGNVVKWQYTTDGGYNWYNITNTGTINTATDLITTTSYRAVVQSGACSATPGGYANVTVRPAMTAGTIGSAQAICYGTSPTMLTSTAGTGSGTISYEWETNATGSHVTIDGATDETYQPPTLSATTSYKRRTVSNNSITCYSDYTTPVTITVYPQFTAGNIKKSGETICYNGDPSQIGDSISGSGGNGTISYQWQSSTDIGFTSPTTLNAITSTYDPPANLTATTLYRRQVKDGTCTAAFTASGGVWKVTISPSPEITGASTVTQGQVITYSTPYNAGNSYTWNASHGNPVICFPNHNCLTLTWDFPCGVINPGYVRVTETNTSTGCSTTATKLISITP